MFFIVITNVLHNVREWMIDGRFKKNEAVARSHAQSRVVKNRTVQGDSQRFKPLFDVRSLAINDPNFRSSLRPTGTYRTLLLIEVAGKRIHGPVR